MSMHDVSQAHVHTGDQAVSQPIIKQLEPFGPAGAVVEGLIVVLGAVVVVVVVVTGDVLHFNIVN